MLGPITCDGIPLALLSTVGPYALHCANIQDKNTRAAEYTHSVGGLPQYNVLHPQRDTVVYNMTMYFVGPAA